MIIKNVTLYQRNDSCYFDLKTSLEYRILNELDMHMNNPSVGSLPKSLPQISHENSHEISHVSWNAYIGHLDVSKGSIKWALM